MHLFAVSAIVIVALATVASCQLSCESQLRLLPEYSHLFTHCQCSYSEWSEWTTISTVRVPTSQCASGKVLIEERRQRVISGTCRDIVEDRTVCEPEVVDQLIMALGLGSRGQHITPGYYNNLPEGDTIIAPLSHGSCSTPGKVCQHVTTPHENIILSGPSIYDGKTGKRSVREERRPRIKQRRATVEADPLATDPIPFNITEHGARYRRQSHCSATSTQHILFILDTSDSVSVTEFNRVTDVLSDLVLYFCKPIKVAVMTFDHEYFKEFCFDCFDNTCDGRAEAREAIRNIDRDFARTGIRYTHTAGAAVCACDFMLTQTCGLDISADCIDVVFITDGKSNDPDRDVCSDILCLHNRFGVNTYAIGIDQANDQELECISEAADPGSFHLFNFLSFDDFENTFISLLQILEIGINDANNDPYVCIDALELGLGTNGCDKR